MRLRLFHAEHEISAMPAGLHGEEGGIQSDAHQPEEGLLCRGQGGSGGGLGVVRHDEAQHRQRDDDAQVGIRTLEVVVLLPVPPGPEQQRRAHHAVQDDHDDREQGIPHHRERCSSNDIITAEIAAASMAVTASVRISVPSGSPRYTARSSACLTTHKAAPRMTANSQREMTALTYAGRPERCRGCRPRT